VSTREERLAVCDRCARVDHADPGHTLPPGWMSHPHTGEVICMECQEKAGRERYS
jgi:hypothetical protein